ncbi:hypothetical protein PR003_g18281 [Phytophthora rubi]|uniref:Uncharacterized protein n=1 Tax=Phytophthora rubi TaxID=129364 RepID=A0A6A3KMW8_9STRA|nr:hypothetical protein PR002_g16991 [Phytophthora rubi]KAE9008681.1 hypothetical protein PR001_g16628 [Phytophthora rubi]KAE9318255.1 hypothetical protein PR003_g18281 [Phytophthora rubi]
MPASLTVLFCLLGLISTFSSHFICFTFSDQRPNYSPNCSYGQVEVAIQFHAEQTP